MAEHHVLALFTDPGPATGSIRELRKLGVPERRIEVQSSIPLPERGPGPAWYRVRGTPFVVIGTLIGLALAFTFTVGFFLLYKIDVGHQGIVPIPTSIIIFFEVTMLGIMVTSFVGFLILNQMPVFSRPTYDARVSDGMIGVLVLVNDTILEAVESALQSAGAIEVKRMAARPQTNLLWYLAAAALVIVLGGVGTGTLFFFYDYVSVPFPTNMVDQDSIAAQQGPRLVVPAASIPIQGPVLISGVPATIPLPSTPDSVQRGQVLFGTNCVLCHGAAGKGDGKVGVYFTPKPFDLTSANVKKISSQDMFLIISQGIGPMPQIGENLSVEERWDVINYVKTLQ